MIAQLFKAVSENRSNRADATRCHASDASRHYCAQTAAAAQKVAGEARRVTGLSTFDDDLHLSQFICGKSAALARAVQDGLELLPSGVVDVLT